MHRSIQINLLILTQATIRVTEDTGRKRVWRNLKKTTTRNLSLTYLKARAWKSLMNSNWTCLLTIEAMSELPELLTSTCITGLSSSCASSLIWPISSWRMSRTRFIRANLRTSPWTSLAKTLLSTTRSFLHLWACLDRIATSQVCMALQVKSISSSTSRVMWLTSFEWLTKTMSTLRSTSSSMESATVRKSLKWICITSCKAKRWSRVSKRGWSGRKTTYSTRSSKRIPHSRLVTRNLLLRTALASRLIIRAMPTPNLLRSNELRRKY